MSVVSLNFAAEKLLEAAMKYYESGEYVKPFQSKDLADCVVQHAAAAGVAAMGVNLIPGAGGIISGGVITGAIWTMYIKICKIIGVPFTKNKLKALSSALLTNIATNLASVLAFNFIPGAGAIAAGVAVFSATYFAGLIFLIMLTKLFKTERTDNLEFDDNAWKESFKSALKDVDKKAIIKEAKDLFMNMRNNGTLEDAGKDVVFESED